MPRQPRLIIEGQPHHIIQRGNNKQVTFVTDEDYQFYLKILKDACIKYQCHIHAYVLMTNHVHLLLTPKENTGISAVMQYVSRTKSKGSVSLDFMYNNGMMVFSK